MDVLLKGPLVVEENKKVDYGGDHMAATDAKISKEHSTYTTKRSSRDATSPPSSPTQKDLTIPKPDQEDELESAQAEMSEVREENERLKTLLARILKDYQSLQMQFLDVVQQQEPSSKAKPINIPKSTVLTHQATEEEADLVSLSLGTSATTTAATTGNVKKEERGSDADCGAKKEMDHGDMQMGGGLTLGLDCKFERSSSANTQPTTNLSFENSFEDPKEEDGGDQWPPSKVLKAAGRTTGEDEVSQQIQIKKARVSVRTRCDGPTMNDGCQWRKYGQKISKGNPCPRAYYRCTVAPACPVRKQVQRCAEDMSILITTYEGTHNHPLPMAATAMASTTSAAASMLLSGSSSSSRSSILSSPFSTGTTLNSSTPSSTLHGLNFNLPNTSRVLKPYFLPSMAPSLETTPMHPTITLDLTAPSSSTTTTTAMQSTQFNRFPSPFASSIPRYPTSLSISSADVTNNSTQSSPWSQLYGNKSQIGSLYQSPYNPNNMAAATPQSQQALTDTLAKAITSDPSFKSALAAAITTIVGGGQGGTTQSVGLGGQLSGISPLSGSATSFSNRPLQNPSSSFFLQPSIGLSSSMSSSSNVEKRDHIR